jgi:hypothetical protein
MSWLRRGVVYQVYPRSFQDAVLLLTLALGGRAGDVVLSARGEGAGRQVTGELRIAGDDALVIRLDGR